MKPLICLLIALTTSAVVEAAPSPLKHAIDVPCEYQGTQAMISRANRTYGRTYQILTSGAMLTRYAVLERFPVINVYAGLLALKDRSSGEKKEVYYNIRAGSVGLRAPEAQEPIFRCEVRVEETTQEAYEAAISRQ